MRRDPGVQGAVDCFEAGKSVYDVHPEVMCACGHQRGTHYGLGPCLGAGTSKATGRSLEGSTCACPEFRALPSAA